jgi:glucose uptake protein GlcU
MKQLIKRLLLPLFMLGMVAMTPAPAYAASAYQACGSNNPSPVCASTNDAQVNSIIKTLVNTLIFILGAIAVIMIVVGGIRYTTSNGDASGIKSAKDTILYAVVGVVVSLLAYTIVNFVLGQF